MRSRPPRLLAAPIAVTAALLTAAAAGAATTQWPTYHLDPSRSGNDQGEPSFHSMHSGWTSAALDGRVYAEPLIYGNTVFVATENNSVYAFDVAGGAPAWSVDPVSLGTPRTSNFPCGDINPLGITGTPVIDGGFLYVLAEVESPPGSYTFHLAKLNPGTGAVVWNHNITPSHMSGIATYEQQRSALAVSNGNVVITWGGLAGDCGPYHGFVETVSESTGNEVHEWDDTFRSGDREGGMWTPSGPAVDSSGNIYVSTGNGGVTNIADYASDYGDSILKLSPSLPGWDGAPSAFFAPGSPQPWNSLNASDADLGSIGPSLLPNGELFAIGKGGRGYLLDPAALPDNSNPGGGEKASLQVCHQTNDAAFGGLAVDGSLVFIPCSDGLAEVNIDSTTSFHRVWYSGAGGSAPIVAGGLVWTVPTSGGTTLSGLDPSTGNVVSSLGLPATTMHFATPAAADGRLFIAAGARLAEFQPATPPPAPPGGGYELDGWGGIHAYGGAYSVSGTGYWPGWDIARGITLRPDRASGYVLDGWGGIHPYGVAPPESGEGYWPGWDIARGIVNNPCDGSGNSGYVLDGWGGIHPFGGAPALIGEGYWSGWDIARGIAVNPCSGGVVSGYTLDGWGGVHPFWQRGTAVVSSPGGGPYWAGWDIARGIVVTGRGHGYVVDGWGGVHPFGGATATTATGYDPGHDVARGMTFSASLQGGYWLDAFGGLHPWWINGTAAIASPSGQPHWSWEIARAVAQ